MGCAARKPPPYSPIFPQQGTVSLSVHARYLYFATQSGAVSRVDLASGAVDLSLPAPPAMNAKVAAVAASRTDDVAAYVQLRPNDLDPDAIGMLRNSQWGTQWTRVPPPVTSNSAPTLAVRDDDAELLSSFAGLNRVRVTAAGPDVVLATAAIASSGRCSSVRQCGNPRAMWNLRRDHAGAAVSASRCECVRCPAQPQPSGVRIVGDRGGSQSLRVRFNDAQFRHKLVGRIRDRDCICAVAAAAHYVARRRPRRSQLRQL